MNDQGLTPMKLKDLPSINAPFDAGTFVGITTLKDGQHAAVCLLPGRATSVTWQAAKKWAEGLGAELPNRTVAAMIFANTQDRPQTGWHWTCESSNDYASCAWGCGFYGGHQSLYYMSYEVAAVAVRLIPLTA